MLSEDVKHITEWLNNNFLCLNYSKTKVMLTGRHERFALVDSFTVRAGDTVLSRVYQFKYLGVMLNPYPSWNDHIALQLHADLSVYFRNGSNRWILYPEGSIYSSGLSLRECLF